VNRFHWFITTSFTSLLCQAVVMLNMQFGINWKTELFIEEMNGKTVDFDIRLLLNAILVSIRSSFSCTLIN